MANSNSSTAPSTKSLPPQSNLTVAKQKASHWQNGVILLGLWLLVAIADLLWLLNDQAPPAWDQGEHLTRALNYWRLLQDPAWLDGDWWTTLWRQSPGYRAPLVYLATVPIFNLLGRGFDQAVVVNLLFAGVLMALLYRLGCALFDRQTGLWAAGLSLLVPAFYSLRLDYLLDLGLTVCVTAAFTCLTGWRSASATYQWLWALAFGVCAGLAILAKPTAILFLLVPALWVLVESAITPPRWPYLVQWSLAAGVMVLFCGPWIQTNWLTILTNSQSNNARWVPPEVVPGSRWSALSYYARMVPRLVTYALLGAGAMASLVGLLQRGQGNPSLKPPTTSRPTRLKWAWLLSFLLGSYALLTLLQNKDPRHITPAIPVLVLVLARGLTLLTGRAGHGLRWLLAGLMVALMIAALLPGGALPPSRLMRTLYRGPAWPHESIINTVLEQEPYLRSTLGVLPNTPQINPQTLDFYGNLRDFRVFGRELGFNPAFVASDARALTWMVTKTGDQGPISDSKATLTETVLASPEFEVAQTWPLPDESTLALHRRRQPAVTVSPVAETASGIRLTAITLPTTAAPGQTIAAIYEILGSWDALSNGLLILSWRPMDNNQGKISWIHDHGLGLGQLLSEPNGVPDTAAFTLTEQLGMILPTGLSPGRYQLSADYVDRRTGQGQSLSIPLTTLTIAETVAPQPAPEPDLVGVLHQLSQGLATGAIDPIFATVGRINQYDPVQDYLPQAIGAMTYRLVTDPEDVRWLYTKVMAQILLQQAEGAIATLNQLTTVAPDNAYHWLLLGFVNLYAWQPRVADQALAKAAQITPDLPELKVLQGVAALQQGRLRRAWQRLSESNLLS